MAGLGAVDRHAGVAPYRQIAQQLRAAIVEGRLPAGERLPSESSLMDHYGVARMTVRQALGELKAEGLVVAEHGRGVFVRSSPRVRRLASERFARRHRKAGKAAFIAESEPLGKPSVDQLVVSQVKPAERIRRLLGLRPGSKVVSRERRYLIDNVPVELAWSYIPLSIARGTPMVDNDTGPGGVYARLEDAGYELESFTEEVTARMPTPDERRRLQLSDGTPVLTVTRVAIDRSGQHVEVTDTVKASPNYVLEYSFPAE